MKDELIIDGRTYRLVEEKPKEPVKPRELWIREGDLGSFFEVRDGVRAERKSVYASVSELLSGVKMREVLPEDENAVLVTREDLAKAWDEIIVHYCSSWKAMDSSYFSMFCKSLGFPEKSEK